MCSFTESNLREDLLGQSENLSLIYSTELCVNIKVLLVQALHNGVLFEN